MVGITIILRVGNDDVVYQHEINFSTSAFELLGDAIISS